MAGPSAPSCSPSVPVVYPPSRRPSALKALTSYPFAVRHRGSSTTSPPAAMIGRRSRSAGPPAIRPF
ncbi:hypothetical protein, partial [Actinoplanes philippinensis]